MSWDRLHYDPAKVHSTIRERLATISPAVAYSAGYAALFPDGSPSGNHLGMAPSIVERGYRELLQPYTAGTLMFTDNDLHMTAIGLGTPKEASRDEPLPPD